MKEFLIMCAKIALGIFIGFVLIFGGENAMDKKASDIQSMANDELDAINFSDITN